MTADITNLRILVVDDEEFVLSLTGRLLKSLGCENFDTAGNGKEAIKKLTGEGEPFDIVICDLKMPDMDGFEFIRQVAEWDATGGFIILSGEGKQALKKAHKMAKKTKMNVLGVIPKPLEAEILKKTLEKFVAT